MKINVNYVYWILLLVTFVSSCFIFVLVSCEVQPSGLQQITGNSSIVHSAGTNADISVKEELKSSHNISPSNLVHNDELHAQLLRSTKHNQREVAAAVHSSFADAEAKPSDIISQSPSDVNISPEIVTEFNNGLTDTGQAVVLTLLESATTELQKQLQTEGLSSSLNEALGSDNLTVETPPSPANQKPAVQEAPDRENRSRQEPEDDLYVTQAEPKVLEVRYNVVDVETVILPALGKKVIVVTDDAKEVEPSPGEEDQHSEGARDPVPAGDLPLTPTPDDIPSFSEWSQKKMEEAEKKVLNGSSAGGPTPVRPPSTSKLRSKNYASPDCGAKIVAANPEAESANSVLSPSRDEYVLNACVNRIWLVVELCEAIQAKKIDIANFELFSSSPKDFSVSVSDRFPSRDWRGVGHFTAQDVRDVQSYDLDPHLFGKFIKVEMHSHYGSEHYCPVSLFRVYGTSEFEVLATEVEAHHPTQEIDEDVEEGTLEGGDPGDPPRNLFGSARAVVMSLVKKATEALVKGAAANDTSTPGDGGASRPSSCGAGWTSTPRHLIVCDNCSDALFHCVWDMLGHRERELYEFVQVPFVRDALRSGPVCAEYGLDFGRRRPLNYPDRPDPGDYLKSLLPDSYMAALCNALAVMESKVVLNASRESNDTAPANTTDPDPGEPPAPDTEYQLLPPEATCSTLVDPGPPPPPNTPTLAPPEAPPDSDVPRINPTRTLTEAEPDDRLFASTRSPDPVEPPAEPPPPPLVEPSVPPGDNSTEGEPARAEEESEFQPEEDASLDTLLSELKELEGPPAPATSAPPPPQKESVFVRISNRIKALERNMSLSGQYLEELSRRYKRQVEEISRTLNRTLAAAEGEARRREEAERGVAALRDQVAALAAAVDRLTASQDDGWPGQHAALIAAEVLLFAGVLCLCGGGDRRWSLAWGRPPVEPTAPTRRKSLGAVTGASKPRRKRPSEVALHIAGTYTDLLIAEPGPAGREAAWTAPRVETKRRRRRKKESVGAGGIPKSSSSASLQPKTSRKTSTNSSSGGGSAPCGDVRRASLSELGASFWLPVNGTEDLWTSGQDEPPRVEVLGAHPPPPDDEVPPDGRGEDSEDSPPVLRESDRYHSLPTFMRTASATRADRHHSSQTGQVPTQPQDDRKKPKGFKKMVKRFF